jgi:predicted glycosyltransferase involved in capsule biosynthesis
MNAYKHFNKRISKCSKNIWILLIIMLLLIFLSFNTLKIYKESFENDNKLIAIIPVRDRDQQLKEYLDHIIPIFKHQNIDYRIYIVEQSKNKPFNKAKINNIGFLESVKENKDVERYLFNDVDNYPKDKDIIPYKTSLNSVHHFYGDKRWLGGFYTISKTIYEKINGYSNDFWGWGGEDGDFLNRLNVFNIPIDRNVFFNRRSTNLIQDEKNERRLAISYDEFRKKKAVKIKSYLKDKNNVYLDGLTTCDYHILKKNVSKDNRVIRFLTDI